MATIDLNALFPEGTSGSRRPLPKQKEFFNAALDPKGPSNIAYFGGYGSGKSLILVITMIALGIVYGGDYVIARQYMPELRRTTMRLFHEIVPKDLLIEWKEAAGECKIKSAQGEATYFFVGLDEAEKLDSLNLSGIGIDEASQTTEEAYLKLQGRLRNKKGLRKSLLVGNPKGHDYVYKYFLEKKCFQDFYHPTLRRVVTADEQKAQYKLIKAPSTENVHLSPDYLQKMFATYSKERIQRDVYGSFDSFEGQVYTEFDRQIHVVQPFRIPETWERHIRIDHGFRNPAAVLFFAISPDGEVYVYREWYKTEHLIKEILHGNPKEQKEGFLKSIQPWEKFLTAKIDPSVKAHDGKDKTSKYDEYVANWPETLPPLTMAKNDVTVGIDRVKSYLKLHPKLKKPLLYIFDTCTNLLEEITTYRYQELRPNQEGRRAEYEKPVKNKDHALDALRYMIVDLPEPYKIDYEENRHLKYRTSEITLQDELKESIAPKHKDPFGM